VFVMDMGGHGAPLPGLQAGASPHHCVSGLRFQRLQEQFAMAHTNNSTASGSVRAAGAAEQAALLPLPVVVMARFRRLMQYEGWEVDLPRMCIDTDYAYRCLATAHTSSSDELRRAALVLFEAYDRNAAIVH